MSVQTIMTADENGAELVTFARSTAQQLVRVDLSKSQIRNIFGEVRQIEAAWPGQEAMRRLNMLKPKLSYSTARSSQLKQLEVVLSEAISLVDQAPTEEVRNERFKRFVNLFEAILAYHKAGVS